MNFVSDGAMERNHCIDHTQVTGPSQIVSLASPGAGLLRPEENPDFDLDIDLIPNFLKAGVYPSGMDIGMSDDAQKDFEIKIECSMVRVYSSDEDV